MKKIISIFLLVILNVSQIFSYTEKYWDLTEKEKYILNFWNNLCEKISQEDIPTIFIPWILSSWYSEEWYNETKVKRWIPDPISHTYDTLFYTFKKNWYHIKDVFYKDQFNLYIEWNPKKSLYLFWYDWKKDNKVTAQILSNLIMQIREKYEKENGCDIWTVNIIWHSMWWLIARAMLENICASEEEYKKYYLNLDKANWKIKNFKTSFCHHYTKINKFITIATPQRWAPKSLIIWEKWDLEKTDWLIKGQLLKQQLWVFTDKWLYNIFHWYDKKIWKWIVTIWQLLPDVSKKWIMNQNLLYLFKNNQKLDNKTHPQNSFLEELNKKENIDKMFSNISWKYILYYSDITWKTDYNNVIWYDISDKYRDWLFYKLDNTKEHSWINIYDKYKDFIDNTYYNIWDILKDHRWLWWDWTVPTVNLLLSTNDTNEIIKENDKFSIEKIICYDEKIWMNTENQLVKKVWDLDKELCSHWRMPILTAIKVYENISWNKVTYFNWQYSLIKEQKLLYSSIWYADYQKIDWWIQRNNNLDNIFSEKLYTKTFKDLKEVGNFIINKNENSVKRKSLSFDWQFKQIDSILRYEVLSPINLIIEDEKWRKIWIDPKTGLIINEIPWAWTSWNTEWSFEPEFFLIPKYSTWKVINKIYSYWTWDGEYKIVLNEIKQNSNTWGINFVIEWNAKKGVLENYLVWIDWKDVNYKLLTKWEFEILKKIELKEKYKDILEKIYNILDTKYNNKKKLKLKNKLEKFVKSDDKRLKNDEKLKFLIDMIIKYLN